MIDFTDEGIVFYNESRTMALFATQGKDYRGFLFWLVKYTNVVEKNGELIPGPMHYDRSENGTIIPNRVCGILDVTRLAKKIGLYE